MNYTKAGPVTVTKVVAGQTVVQTVPAYDRAGLKDARLSRVERAQAHAQGAEKPR